MMKKREILLIAIILSILALFCVLVSYLKDEEKSEIDLQAQNNDMKSEEVNNEIEVERVFLDTENEFINNSEPSESTTETATKRAIIVKVDENSLIVEDTKRPKSELSIISLRNIDDDIEFKVGQEVMIYYDGIVNTSYPGQINGVQEIKILKEQSDIQITEGALRYAYSTIDNVDVSVSELTSTGITLNIKDTNEYQYDYSHEYSISKLVRNPNYTGIGHQIGENTENSTAGYTGTGPEYIYKDLDVISNISSEETEIINTLNDIIERKFDWTSLYGILDERKI